MLRHVSDEPNSPEADDDCAYKSTCNYDWRTAAALRCGAIPKSWSHPVMEYRSTVLSHPVTVQLDNRDLWRQFNVLGTEMVITRSGRRMFPPIKLSMDGLRPHANYALLVDIVPYDDCRYKYNDSHWSVTGKSDSYTPSSGFYVHPESPASGRHWMSEIVSFHKIKLTNNCIAPMGHTLLKSMQRYQPRVHVVITDEPITWSHSAYNTGTMATNATVTTDDVISVNHLSNYVTFVFPETSFMAVTAYQNERVTQLKIDNNPFAKGFRPSTASKT